MQIGNKPCRIYGEPHAKYLLLQMTGEHELQSMESAVSYTHLDVYKRQVLGLEVHKGEDQLVLDHLPQNAGHLVAVHQMCIRDRSVRSLRHPPEKTLISLV